MASHRWNRMSPKPKDFCSGCGMMSCGFVCFMAVSVHPMASKLFRKGIQQHLTNKMHATVSMSLRVVADVFLFGSFSRD